jgi:ABC-type nitrate/sulfonate/bicarbonate transport system substrate-binding protein
MPFNLLFGSIVHAGVALLAHLVGGWLLIESAVAAEKLRVGKAVPEAFSFVPLDIGMRKGIFAKNGVEIESIAFAGDARMQQAAAADSIDILLGSGPAMAFIVKGAPIKGVAGMAGPPLLLAIVVRPDGPQTAADLKGKKVSVSTAGSLTYWLVSETSRRQGWGPKGIEIAPMGALPGQFVATQARRHRRRHHRTSATPSTWRRRAKAALWCASPTSRTSIST